MPESIRLPGYSNSYISYLSTAMSTRTLAGVTVPDTPVITAAIELARKHLSDFAYNHIMVCLLRVHPFRNCSLRCTAYEIER